MPLPEADFDVRTPGLRCIGLPNSHSQVLARILKAEDGSGRDVTWADFEKVRVKICGSVLTFHHSYRSSSTSASRW